METDSDKSEEAVSPNHSAEPVRISRLAVASFVLGILSVLTCGITSIPAIILGVIAGDSIDLSGGRLTGKRMTSVAITLGVISIGLLIAVGVLRRMRGSVSYRMLCGTNLSTMGKGMLIYANDYDDKFPRAACPQSRWTGKTPHWRADTRDEAFDLDNNGGEASISASLYLLVKYTEIPPESFLCAADKMTEEFRPRKYKIRKEDVWDFGPDSTKHCSFAYHMPYGKYALSTYRRPGMAVAADRNPWQKTPGFNDKTRFGLFDPNGTAEQIRYGNASTHKGDGQNVLFLDCHVGFEMTADCGVEGDNIYTAWDGEDIRRGVPPKIGKQPQGPTDSLLVHDGEGTVPTRR